MKNIWGHSVSTPVEYLQRPSLRIVLQSAIERVCQAMGIDPVNAPGYLHIVQNWTGSILNLERHLRGFVRSGVSESKLAEAIRTRSNIIFRQIEPHLTGGSLLDCGCGNGLIASMCARTIPEIVLLDVVNYVDRSVRLPFVSYTEGAAIPVDRSFDTTLLLTVLHHSNNPLQLLNEVWSHTSKRLLIIESVTDFEGGDVNDRLSTLSSEEQFGYAVVIDWFYNRVLHQDIPVPYNFTSQAMWKKLFADRGMRLERHIDLGIDIGIAPEHHALFVLAR